MSYLEAILSGHDNPNLLENLYRRAQQEDKTGDFAAGLDTCYRQEPDNLLYAAWHYRLQQAAGQGTTRSVNWRLAVPLAVVLSLVFWVLSLDRFQLNFADGMPYLAQIWSLIAGSLLIVFLAVTARQGYKRALIVLSGFLFFGTYALLFSIWPNDQHYQLLMAVHLPLLAWIGVGTAVLGSRAGHANRFAFLIKSIEVLVVGGIYLIGGAVFAALTFGLFQTIDIQIPEPVEKLIFPGGTGLIMLLATASTYHPRLAPVAQNFRHGLSRLVSTLMRLLMPLALLVLVVFGYFILQPDNFWIPFNDRDALITYNALLFAIVFLLIGAIPVVPDDLPPKTQALLRQGFIGVASLTVLVSLYAMSATVYRTYLGTITMNRLTVMGWNVINIGLLLLLAYRLLRAGQNDWIRAAQVTYSLGIIPYIIWTIFIILAVPFIFGQGLAPGRDWLVPSVASDSTEISPAIPGEAERLPLRPPILPTSTPAALTRLPQGCPPDCASADLAQAYLPEIDLRGANLTGANLKEADLHQADLREAMLGGADLRGADLRQARLEQASLHGAKIDGSTRLDDKWRLVWQIVNQGAEKRNLQEQTVDLSQANLRGASLRESDLTNGSLSQADLRGADLTGANLTNVSLSQAIIDDTTKLDEKWRLVWEIVNHGASRRNLSGANLSQANLVQADLRWANLSQAVLTDTNLSQANLYGADLSGAILIEPDREDGQPHQATLHLADLAGVKIDGTTQIEERWRLVWEIVNRGAKNRNLNGADLTGADLQQLDLSGANLSEARLDGASLRGANLSGADLTGVSLHSADLTGANLAGANLYEAQLNGASLPSVLSGANLRKANLSGLDLAGYDLSGLNLSRAELRWTNLAEADLSGADLSEAHLEGAYLWQANLQNANMRGVYLAGAYLWQANLAGVDLTGAEMYEAVMPDGASHE